MSHAISRKKSVKVFQTPEKYVRIFLKTSAHTFQASDARALFLKTAFSEV